jgi:hypothetical protein
MLRPRRSGFGEAAIRLRRHLRLPPAILRLSLLIRLDADAAR